MSVFNITMPKCPNCNKEVYFGMYYNSIYLHVFITLPKVNMSDPSHDKKNLSIVSMTESINQNVFKLITLLTFYLILYLFEAFNSM